MIASALFKPSSKLSAVQRAAPENKFETPCEMKHLLDSVTNAGTNPKWSLSCECNLLLLLLQCIIHSTVRSCIGRQIEKRKSQALVI